MTTSNDYPEPQCPFQSGDKAVALFHQDPDVLSLVFKRRGTTIGRKAWAFLETELATIKTDKEFRHAYDNLLALGAVLSEAKKPRKAYLDLAMRVLDRQWALSKPARSSERVDRLVKAFSGDLAPDRLSALEEYLRDTLEGD